MGKKFNCIKSLVETQLFLQILIFSPPHTSSQLENKNKIYSTVNSVNLAPIPLTELFLSEQTHPPCGEPQSKRPSIKDISMDIQTP